MGIFNSLFGKKAKEKPTLISDIKIASACIIKALNSSGYKVDLKYRKPKRSGSLFC